MKQATEAYRQESDTLGQFLAECCDMDAGAKARASTLLEAYQQWSGDKHITQKELASRLHDKGYENRKSKGNVTFWHGINLALEPGWSG